MDPLDEIPNRTGKFQDLWNILREFVVTSRADYAAHLEDCRIRDVRSFRGSIWACDSILNEMNRLSDFIPSGGEFDEIDEE